MMDTSLQAPNRHIHDRSAIDGRCGKLRHIPAIREKTIAIRQLKDAMIDLSAQQQIEGYEKAKAIPPRDIREKRA